MFIVILKLLTLSSMQCEEAMSRPLYLHQYCVKESIVPFQHYLCQHIFVEDYILLHCGREEYFHSDIQNEPSLIYTTRTEAKQKNKSNLNT